MKDQKVDMIKIPIIDGHCDSLLEQLYGRRRLGIESNTGHADFPRLLKGGVKAQFLAIFIETKFKPHKAVVRALEGIDAFYKEFEETKDILQLILTKEDTKTIFENKKLGILLSIEGGEALGGKISSLNMFYRLGIRSIGLTWNQRNDLADGVGVKKLQKGLTEFGKEVVTRMNQLGMIIDLAHMAEKGFWDTLLITEDPVVVSHANCYSLCPHPRNLRDDQLRALAKNRGLIGITFVPDFVDQNNPTLHGVLDHIEYAVDIAGVNHVGLGSDFDGMEQSTPGLETALQYPKLLLGLQDRGFTKEDIAKIAGGNWQRILAEVLPAK